MTTSTPSCEARCREGLRQVPSRRMPSRVVTLTKSTSMVMPSEKTRERDVRLLLATRRSDQPNDQCSHGDRGQGYRQRLPRDATVVAAEDGASVGPSVDPLRVTGVPIDGDHHIVVCSQR